jgi:hypothetical protein
MTLQSPVIFATGDASFDDHVPTDMIEMSIPSGDATIRVMMTLHQLSTLARRSNLHMRVTLTHAREGAEVISFPKGARS